MAVEIHYNVYGCFRDPRSDITLAKSAVDAGFEGIWIGDHFLPWIDSRPYTHHVFPWFGSLMSEVPDVPVGTSVTCPIFRYRPPLVAQAFATLDNMYPGRVNLGVGVGEALNEAHFTESEWPDWSHRARMLIEAIDVMKRLWNEDGYVEYDGDYFQYEGLKLYTGAKSDIPVHWAGWGPKSVELAGRFADHLLTAAPADRIDSRIVPNFKEGLEKADRDFESVDVTTEFTANIGDPDELAAEIREMGEYTPDDTELDNPDPRSIQRVADRRLEDLSDAELIEENNITDDPDDIVAELEALEDAGVSRVLVGSKCGDPYETIEAFEEHVIPHFE
ncbi:LLM class flavin-dependent oxidoreductase [Natronorubrum halophilum]|uniref:LLM class flavin-dependent oxidoreductase n=1 Tax=Natronorubrum halophilum TaxID=1702106 RepID=UPI0010C1AC8E|nr:LLM class flavin-dependent oxidoreductase [Natronorubrum halophilum]